MAQLQRLRHAPFAGLDVPDGDWELTVSLTIDRQDYRRDPEAGEWPEPFCGDFTIAAGCKDGRWRLRVQPALDVETGKMPAMVFVDLADQTGGPNPLALLRALLTGRAPTAGG